VGAASIEKSQTPNIKAPKKIQSCEAKIIHPATWFVCEAETLKGGAA